MSYASSQLWAELGRELGQHSALLHTSSTPSTPSTAPRAVELPAAGAGTQTHPSSPPSSQCCPPWCAAPEGTQCPSWQGSTAAPAGPPAPHPHSIHQHSPTSSIITQKSPSAASHNLLLQLVAKTVSVKPSTLQKPWQRETTLCRRQVPCSMSSAGSALLYKILSSL